MRYILLVILVLISFGTSAQAPPMNIGGPQGINVKRILAQDWMSVPIMADTPVAPLTGSGWPGRGYIVFVAQNPDSICGGCPPADTSLWEYTGQRWKRVGMDYLTKLVFGGEVTQSNTFSRRFFVGSYGAFINGSYYSKVPFTTLTTSSKTADSTSRIDAIVLTPLGPTIKVGIPKQVPLKPSISSDEIELSTIYFPPFDTVARFIPVATGVTSVFRVPGKDSIFYTIDTVTFAIKDSIGISVATNGLTASDKTIKLGGSLTENTNINLSSSRLNVFTGSDTARFVNNGGMNLIVKGSGTNQSVITSDVISSTNTSNGKSAFLDYSGSLGLNNGTYESYLENANVTNPLVTLRFPNKPTGNYTIAVTSDTVNLSNRINTKLNISDTAAMLNPYKFTADNGLTKDSTVFRLGGSLNQNTAITLNNRNLYIARIAGDTVLRFAPNGRVMIGTTDSTESHRLRVSGNSRLGFLQITDNSNASNTGQGIRIDGVDRTFNFQGTSAAAAASTFQFVSWVGDTVPAQIGNILLARDIISVRQGLSRILGAPTDTARANVLNIQPKYNIFYDSGHTIVRGIYYNPTLQALNKTTHIAYQNTTGSNLLNSSFGNTRIGYNTSDTTYKLDVNGIARVRDTLTLATAPVTSDTTANDLLVINSSNGQVRRYTGDWYSMPINGSATLDFGNTSAHNSSDLTIAVTGAAAGDVVSLGVPNGAVSANTCFTAWVSATDTVTVRFNNYSTGAIDPASGTFKIKVFK